MNIEEFKKVAEELFCYASHLSLSCAWEPLINKDFSKYLEIASNYKLPHIEFVTNGILFTDDILETCIRAPVHLINISIDTADKSQFEEICGRDCFDRVIDNLKTIRTLKMKIDSRFPMVNIIYTIFQENAHQLIKFLEEYNAFFDSITVNSLLLRKRNTTIPYNRMTAVEFDTLISKCKTAISGKPIKLYYSYSDVNKHWGLCGEAFRYINISSNGNVTLCTKKIIGNIFKNTFQDICKQNRIRYWKMFLLQDDYCSQCGS